MPRQFTLNVEENAGLWIVTSRNAVANGSLLVAEHSLEAALAAVPERMKDLERAAAERPDWHALVESRPA